MNQYMKAICVCTAILSLTQAVLASESKVSSNAAGDMVYVPNPKYLGASKPTAAKPPAPKASKEFGYTPNSKYLPAARETKSGD